jgi:hypothetical protein
LLEVIGGSGVNIKHSSIGILLLLAGCASDGPHYQKMRTADDALNNYDQNVIKDGMAITKKGSVVDIKIEEVQAEKNRLAAELEDKNKKIEVLEEKLSLMERDMTQLRIFVGLPSSKPQTTAQCCTADGKLLPETINRAPSLDEELSLLKRKP